MPPGELPALARAEDATLTTVTHAVDRLIAAEDDSVERGMSDALRLVPFPLRKLARNVLFGDGR